MSGSSRSGMNRPHDGLRDPEHPGRAFTPNEKYAALVEAAGYVPVALGPDDYVELLPAAWRAVNAYGIKLNRRSYDSEELNPLRLQPSGVREHKEPLGSPPRSLRRLPHPRPRPGRVDHRVLEAPGPGARPVRRARLGPRPPQPGPRATEEQIADAVAALLRRANTGPARPGASRR